ncbi:DEAD/DEAH box helicase [Aquimarina pacifica]|uniref:DEAD/DEAH box helicase n=1 Tax=Aquimarina pacifica TaxID=1296415 RepID=UPI000472AA3D|nr:AAA domain-containing protein [Aquimarina pacifica]
MSNHKKLLSCWHKLEHFSPALTPKASEKNVELLNNIEPWKIPLRPKDPKKTIEYTIYLGVFDSSVVNEFVKEYFKDTKKDENFRNSKICYASLKLDTEGKYINDSFGISTLPWALNQLENNKIKNDNWELTFETVKDNLLEYLELNFKETITNSSDEIIQISTVVNNNQLLKFQNKVESLSNWSVKPPKEIYVKRIEKFKSKNETKSNADILNSFYINDLEKIISIYDKKSIPKAFRQYLDGSLNKQSSRLDVSKSVEKLKTNLSPSNYPDGCWPSDYTLSLMQQFAVNNIFNNLAENSQEGMFSVNGPPGTGKTTLLRDVIAPIIVKRAKELIKITNPSDGFKKVGSLEINENYSPWLYEPIESITNGGIVIASSNNGAVENISKELPLKEEVSKLYNSEIAYFKTAAENSLGTDSWGLISAVLGNKKNRTDFINKLWFDFDKRKKIGLQKSLDENKLFDNSEWELVKTTFKTKLKEISVEKERLESLKKDYETFVTTKNILFETTQNLEQTKKEYEALRKKFQNQKDKVFGFNNDKKEIINELAIIKSSKPNFFSYWFNKYKRNTYKKASETALNTYNQISKIINIENSILSDNETNFNNVSSLLKKQEEEKAILTVELKKLTDLTENARLELKNNYADTKYWKNIESKKSQESCPWYSERLKKLQSELFIISLNLNEVFVLTANATSSRISTTLAGFFEYLKGGSNPSKKEIKGMWNTFFLVIPVISSTFASIQTMFKDLTKEDIPWLFIDEAGQAIPQAAAGSIWRSKRVGVVGDPFQIEPVVTIPNSITDNISNYFDLGKDHISSELSVQSTADRINPLGSYLTINNKEEWIGIPLRVHRRCISPMFEISNNIAYDNTMYCSTKSPKSIKVNFKTSFIHCKGTVKGRHFVQEQAEIIKEILINEINFSKTLPDVFVITPFSQISYSLNSFLFKHLINEAKKYKEIDSTEMGVWLKGHIGTVHTFQGKQAEGVILCLGLDKTTTGAANWASQKPNLLNVAITRAKYRFIAIGDKEIWLKQAYFNQLNKLGAEAGMDNNGTYEKK